MSDKHWGLVRARSRIAEQADRIEELEAALRKQRQVFGRSPSLTYAAMRMDGIARQALGDEA
jgi:uncharacterized coiled-coil protein SlyX